MHYDIEGVPKPHYHITKENASAIGKLGGGQSKKVDLGPLVTVEDAKHRLDVICQSACNGKLSGAIAGAANRSVEVWLKALESDHTKQLHALRDRVLELERELKGSKVSY